MKKLRKRPRKTAEGLGTPPQKQRKGVGALRSRFRGMYWQQLFVTAGMVLLTLSLLGIAFFALSYRYARTQKNKEIEVRARAVERLCGDFLQRHSYSMDRLERDENFRRTITSAAEVSDVQFLVCDQDGRALLKTDPALQDLRIQMPAEMTEEIRAGNVSRGSLAGIYQGRRFVVGVGVTRPDSDEVVGEVFAVSTTTTMDILFRGFTVLFFTTAFAVLVIAFLASSFTASQLVRPLREMVQATRQYARGEFDTRMKDFGPTDEIGELAAAFNQMADSLQQQERQRREFMSNVSHDLKTPLTSIAGYTDGLLDGTIPRENERRYLMIISEESRRLSRMVRRILDVSQIQAADPLRSGSTFDLCESMRQVLISLERKIRDRNLDVDADIPDEQIFVFGDEDMIIQVLYNLLENAAKFARQGSTLYFGAAERDGRAFVTVRNLGETIPPEELPLLFDRFHKSDKSRGEDRDGVGLGLYIVKTILKQHKEEIFVSSEYGVTEFSFSLRIA